VINAWSIIPRFFSSPLTRMSFGLVVLTISVMFASEFMGLVPDVKNSELKTRKVIAEMLAVQLSMEVRNNKKETLQNILESVLERNSQVRSVAVRTETGGIIAKAGEHEKLWTLKPGERSTPTQIQVALFDGATRWGNVELQFDTLGAGGNRFSFQGSFLWLIVFMSLSGFLAYRFFLQRALQELNPDAVIPDRVRKALDTLTEGLLLVDRNDTIIFANEAFARKTGLQPERLVGKESSTLDWKGDFTASAEGLLPWVAMMQGKPALQGTRLQLTTALKITYTFNVKVSPIMAGDDTEIKGVLITFDDITELELKNEELHEALDKLEERKLEIIQQNQSLLRLATRDSLTDTLNRRALFEGFDALFAEIQQEDGHMACVMVDIDHFKSVNDIYGHAVGDEAIKFLANTLTQLSRSGDLIGRMGGEEFVVVMPGVDVDVAKALAEQMRVIVAAGVNEKYPDMPKITSSFGVAMLSADTPSAKKLLEQSDQALYVAKNSGRNKVVIWSDTMAVENVPSTETSTHEKIKIAETMPSNDEQFRQDSTRSMTNVLAEQVPTEKVSCPPDKVLLLERIHQAMSRVKQYQNKIAVLVLDIDALKRVSDTLGTLSAEKFAKTLTARIKETLQAPDAKTEKNTAPYTAFSVTRFNGNEFVILLGELEQSALITSFLYRIFAMNDRSVSLEGHEFYLNIHIGVSVFPGNGQTADELLSNASIAMQEAKRKPDRNNFQFYHNDLSQRAKKLIQLEAELHLAVERDELSVYYQPRVELKTGTISGMEALVRWNHPQLGLVSPDEFIPLAEQTGLIHNIGQWLVRAVCLQIKFWQSLGCDMVVSINLSPVEFRNAELADEIIALVREMGVEPKKLDFEIKETVVMHSVEAARTILKKLHQAGFTMSLDDFGTGYSSLSYLKNFPVRKIKIDNIFIKDFVKSANDAAIVSALIAMSHSLDLRVVAEGVETEEQLHFLQDLHCDEVQGYLFAGAMPTDKATNLLLEPSAIRRMIMDYQTDQILPLERQQTPVSKKRVRA
jgi:diguanylate cyclase (GGDEF)-like protein/PAS domain S-box-containing protein